MDRETRASARALNAAWREFIVERMALDPSFKLVQGTSGLPSSGGSDLFLMADAIPPETSVFHIAGARSYASDYSMLLQALLPEKGTTLAATLGNNYINWINHRNAFFKEHPTSASTQLDIFTEFAAKRLEPRRAQQAIGAFVMTTQQPLNLALDGLIAPANSQVFITSPGKLSTRRTYSPTLESAKAELNAGKGLRVDFRSSDYALSPDQIEAAASGHCDIFSADVLGGFEHLNKKAAASDFSVSGRINHYRAIQVDRGPWFNAAEYHRAYAAKDAANSAGNVWDPQANAGGWEAFFGQPDGGLARRVDRLLVVTDYELKVTSNATYSQTECQEIATKASFGIWPFFSSSASHSQPRTTKLDAQGRIETVFKLAPGDVEIWGATVLDAPK